jgi:hypothetical protein
MAKGQKRKSREVRKPKAEKVKAAPPATFLSRGVKPGQKPPK